MVFILFFSPPRSRLSPRFLLPSSSLFLLFLLSYCLCLLFFSTSVFLSSLAPISLITSPPRYYPTLPPLALLLLNCDPACPSPLLWPARPIMACSPPTTTSPVSTLRAGSSPPSLTLSSTTRHDASSSKLELSEYTMGLLGLGIRANSPPVVCSPEPSRVCWTLTSSASGPLPPWLVSSTPSVVNSSAKCTSRKPRARYMWSNYSNVITGIGVLARPSSLSTRMSPRPWPSTRTSTPLSTLLPLVPSTARPWS